MTQYEMDNRIERMTHRWFAEAQWLCEGSPESAALVLASVLQMVRFAIEWQPDHLQEGMREKALHILSMSGTSCEGLPSERVQ